MNCALRVFHGAARVALAEADALGMSEPLAALRNYARLEGISTTDATAATEQPQAAQAELHRLTGPDQGLRLIRWAAVLSVLANGVLVSDPRSRTSATGSHKRIAKESSERTAPG